VEICNLLHLLFLIHSLAVESFLLLNRSADQKKKEEEKKLSCTRVTLDDTTRHGRCGKKKKKKVLNPNGGCCSLERRGESVAMEGGESNFVAFVPPLVKQNIVTT